ncbi:alpha/beta hydrolase [Nesterenkonia sp. MY13]|uniref:Alpha/beta hydrolase n=1 Tax=Nesterenkonia sedimenti TaxID=1463632 RepID=A0A7X8YDR1_9MICC|nr:alpha/beta hydrolase [Nesterenkonia sedimenti]NLS09953.1 alpha/beta hydrolase [Nesterenkonia sedimenti]
MGQLRRPTELARLDSGRVEYRFEEVGDRTVLLFHGGHMHAGMAMGEAAFTEVGYSVLAITRPGYGKTDLPLPCSTAEFADVVVSLCQQLGINQLAAVVGISAGGPFATALAARHPEFVERVILQSAVGPLSWPESKTRRVGRVIFGPPLEGLTWTMVRILFRGMPNRVGLQMMAGELSNLSGQEVLAALSEAHQAQTLELFGLMRSYSGFRNDLKVMHQPTEDEPQQPALVIHSRHDGSVPFAHAEALHESMPNSELIESSAVSHFLWFDDDWTRLTEYIRGFLGHAE